MDKRYLSKIAIYILLAIFALALIIELCYHFFSSVSEDVETVSAEKTTAELSLRGECFIFRDETVIPGDTDGSLCKYLVSNGDKVSDGQKIAEIVDDSDENRQKLSEIEELEGEIACLEGALTLSSKASIVDVEKKISYLRMTLCDLSESGDKVAMSNVSSELSVALAASKIIRGELKNCRELISNLESQKSTLERSVSGKAVKIDKSGSFYASVDGFEGLLSTATLDSLTLDDCISAVESVRSSTPSSRPEGVGKVVTSFDWYALCVVDNDRAAGFASGREYELNFGTVSHKMTLVRVIRSEDGDKMALLFESNKTPNTFDYPRLSSVSVVYGETDGYELPAEALRMVDGVSGVYVLHGNVVEFRQIKILFGNDGAFFSEDGFEPDKGYTALSRYDVVIVKGKDLYVGKIVD